MSSMENTNSFILKDALLFTGTTFLSDSAVIVRDGIITYAGHRDAADTLPADLPVLSRPNHTLLPGLIDSHVHGLEGNVDTVAQSLRFGVTTVCDMHNDPHSIAKLQQLATDSQGKHRYADFKCAGAGATIAGGWPEPIIRMEYASQKEVANAICAHLPKLQVADDAERFVDQQIERHGASYIKLMHELGDTISMDLPRPPHALEAALVQAAHARGRIAVGHAFSSAGALDLLRAGIDGLTHAFTDEPTTDEWLSLMKHNGTHCNPTFSCLAAHAGIGETFQVPFTNDPLSQKMLTDPKPRGDTHMAASSTKGSFDQAVRNVRAMYNAGITLIAGSDCAGKHLGTTYGMGLHIELHLMRHRIGMSTEEVLRSATSAIAERFGFEDRGMVVAGRKADLLLVHEDVRKHYSDENALCLPVRAVWRDGVLCEAYREQV